MLINKLKIWLSATRAETLFISISPITIGVFLAHKQTSLDMPILILTFLYGVFLHLATNLSNDYYDYIKGADNENRIAPFSTIQLKLTSLIQIKIAFLIFFSLAFVIGTMFIYKTGLLILILFALPIFSGFFYTGGSKPLGYLGLGEILVFIFFGPFCVLGTYYLQTLKLCYLPVLAGFANGFFATTILAINNLRDMHLDEKANKKTLAVRFGAKFAKTEILLLIFFAFSISLFFYFITKNIFFLTSLLLIFFIPFKTIFKLENLSLLNVAIQKIVMIQTAYTILFCIALI